MKCIPCIIFFLSLFLSESAGQFFIGASGGINLASAQITPANSWDPDLNVKPAGLLFSHIGILPGFHIGNKWTILTEIQISHKGFHTFKPSVIDRRHRYTYLDMLPQIEFSIFNNLSIGTGCNVGFAKKGMFRIGRSQWQKMDFTRTIKWADVGVLAYMKLKTKKFFLVGRYNHGMLNIRSHFFDEVISHRNTTIQIGLGYFFHRAKEAIVEELKK